MPIEKFDKTFYPNSEITGVSIRFYHTGVDTHPETGGDHKFGIETVLPPVMKEGVDWERCKTDKEYREGFASDSLMMHVDAMEKSLAMHPDCVEVTDFFGRTHDVSDLGLEQLLGKIEGLVDEITAPAAQQAYEDEKARGLVPKDMSFDDWNEANDMMSAGTSLKDWEPKGPAN